MVIKINRLSSIFYILFILLWLPGYFGFYSPYAEGSYQNVPFWLNVIITVTVIFTIGLAIKSLSYYLIINDSGITQKTIGSWTIKWQEIRSWGYSLGSEVNYLYLDLISDKKRKAILSAFLDEKKLPLIKEELERRLGKPIEPSD